MISELKVRNFLSFKNEQIISFEASSDNYLKDYHTFDIDEETPILRLSIIYGANASGKSNLLEALNFIRKQCIITKERNQPTGFIPFSFDSNSKSLPGIFEISFYASNHKYVYSLTLDNTRIIDEKLVYYPGAQPALIFHRIHEKEEEYSFKTGSKIKVSPVELAVLKSNTLSNMTIISGYSKTNIKFPELKIVYGWFNDIFMAIKKPADDIFRETIMNFLEQSAQYKDFIFKGLKKADFNISDIFIEPNDILMQNYEGFSVLSEYNPPFYYSKSKVFFIHQNKVENTDVYEKLDARFQSAGTLKYFGLLGLIKQAIDNNLILNFDEFENSLHPELFNHLINLYLYHSKMSGSKSQIIFTTHHTDLLDSDFTRKDIVWFTEKQTDGSTVVYPLSDFDIRKNLSFGNAYKAGKFGALPNIGII